MHSMKRAMRWCVLAGAVAIFVPTSTRAEDYFATRSVRGVVLDDGGEPIRGAIVKLEDLRTLQIRSFITHKDGVYRFHGLSTEKDYQLTAEWKGRSSDKKTLTRFNSKAEAVIDLKLKRSSGE